MESARDRYTGEIVDAEQLWVINPVDPLGFECRGCGALATPHSYRSENKAQIWPRTALPQNSGWPWPRNSTSECPHFRGITIPHQLADLLLVLVRHSPISE